MIQLCDLEKRFGGQVLFSGVTMQLLPQHRYGLVGANGAGKSTLLRMLDGSEESNPGEVQISPRLRMGSVQQDHFDSDDQPIRDVVMMGQAEVFKAIQDKEKILEIESMSDADIRQLGELEERINALDGYRLESSASEILEGLGIPTERHLEPLSALSGGFKLRVLLAQALVGDPEILILDEPTNHLDIISIAWLEGFLREYEGLAVIVSHDRTFLETVCTDMLDVDYETVTYYKGNYSAFEQQKALIFSQKEAEIKKRKKEIDDRQKFVDRFKAKATKARQAQSRVKQIAKIKVEKLPESSRRAPHISIIPRRPSGKEVLHLEKLSKAYDHPVLTDVNFSLFRGEKVAVIGANGVGKSTLLKAAIGEIDADAGKIDWGHETHIGYFPQDHATAIGKWDGDVLTWLWQFCSEESESKVRSRLGALLFSGDDVKKKVSSLSGGEMARLLMAKLGVLQPNVLIMDEPTNHLDLETIAALKKSLQEYEGTLLFVSHDRFFIDGLSTRTLQVSAEHIEEKTVKAEPVAKKEKAKPKLSKNAQQKLERELEKLTDKIDKLETQQSEMADRLLAPSVYTDSAKVKKISAEQTEVSAQLETAMARWEELGALLE